MADHEKEVTRRIKEKIMEKDPTAEVILFGSHARGDANKDSDWDILILVNIPEPQDMTGVLFRGICNPLPTHCGF